MIGQENRVKYTDVNVTKKVIRPETRFSFNLHDFKPPADSEERAAAVKQPPARPPTLPSRKNRYAPLPPTIGRPPQITPKRIVGVNIFFHNFSINHHHTANNVDRIFQYITSSQVMQDL